MIYDEFELQNHLKKGNVSKTGELSLYHPFCDFCNKRFYDLDHFRLHFKISSHFKCDICDVNAKKLKYVYYKNYDQLE